MLETVEASENAGITVFPGKDNNPTKLIYTNACSMGNKQKELQAMAQLKNYDLVVMEVLM